MQRYRIETGYYSTRDPIALARAFAGVLQTDPDIQWVSFSEAATGRFMGARRLEGDGFILNVSELLVSIITTHRGFVVDFLGDAAFAVFGAPQPDQTHVEQALACRPPELRGAAPSSGTGRAGDRDRSARDDIRGRSGTPVRLRE